MTDPAIIAASYAAEINYTHNPDDVIDPSSAVLAIGTEKVDTTTLKDRSPENNNADIHGAMPTEGFIQGRRFTAANSNYLDCGNDSSLDITGEMSISAWVNPSLGYGNQNNPGIISKRDGSWGGIWVDNIDGKLWGRIYQSDGALHELPKNTVLPTEQLSYIELIFNPTDNYVREYINLNEVGVISYDGTIQIGTDDFLIGVQGIDYFSGLIKNVRVENRMLSIDERKQIYNTLARLTFWSVNYEDYPNNVTEYTDRLPYSSTIISSGTFKVDDDKLQCVSAGTITYSASYNFDGSEYIKVEIDGVEYAGTGTITQGNTTVSVAQGSNHITIAMGTGDTIEGEIGIQFREEV